MKNKSKEKNRVAKNRFSLFFSNIFSWMYPKATKLKSIYRKKSSYGTIDAMYMTMRNKTLRRIRIFAFFDGGQQNWLGRILMEISRHYYYYYLFRFAHFYSIRIIFFYIFEIHKILIDFEIFAYSFFNSLKWRFDYMFSLHLLN